MSKAKDKIKVDLHVPLNILRQIRELKRTCSKKESKRSIFAINLCTINIYLYFIPQGVIYKKEVKEGIKFKIFQLIPKVNRYIIKITQYL